MTNIQSYNNLDDKDIYDDYQEYYNDEIYDSNYINLTPKEVLESFRYNFEGFIEIILERKNVPTEDNNMERKYIVMGINDWYNYIINIFEDLYSINETKSKINSEDLSRFI